MAKTLIQQAREVSDILGPPTSIVCNPITGATIKDGPARAGGKFVKRLTIKLHGDTEPGWRSKNEDIIAKLREVYAAAKAPPVTAVA